MRQAVAFLLASISLALVACTQAERQFGSGGGGEGPTTGTTTGTTGTTGTTSSTVTGTGGGTPCVDEAGCDDGDVCTTDTCEQGVCKHALDSVDDNDACTTDACDPVTGVSHVPVVVDDGDPCTVDACDKLNGVTHAPVDVDDGDACTTDTCDPVTGPVHTAVTVDDGDPCTADACDELLGLIHSPILDPTKLQLSELNIGEPDYVVITNTDTCPNSLAGLRLLFDGSSGNDVTTMLPAQMIPAGGTVEVTDAANPPAPKIPVGAAVTLGTTGGGAVMLCNGPCTAANVIDAVAFSIAAPPPALPAGVTFGPKPLRGINAMTAQKSSFRRIAENGAAPSFLASDWSVGRACDIRNLELMEINVGADDYAVIHNPTTCKLQLSGLQVLFDDSSLADLTANLPVKLIGPGEYVRLIETPVYAADLAVGAIPFSASRGGCVLLCEGACNVAANVIDAVCFDGSQAHPPLPAGVTFNAAGVTGLTLANQSTLSVTRVAESGAAPAFVSSDWALGPLCSAQTGVVLGEMSVGVDFVRLDNPRYCTIDLGGMQILFDDSSLTDLTTVLPSFQLAAGQSVYVREPAQAAAGDISSGGNIPYAQIRGGSTLLCTGVCTSAANVVDVAAFSTGAPFPPLPTGISFTAAGLLGIDATTENTHTWQRGAVKGKNPSFLASDWFVAPSTL